MGGTEVKQSDPVVSFRETVSAESSTQCLSKSPNKHNRLYLSACPLETGIPEDVEEGRLNPRDDAKVCVCVFCLYRLPPPTKKKKSAVWSCERFEEGRAACTIIVS